MSDIRQLFETDLATIVDAVLTKEDVLQSMYSEIDNIYLTNYPSLIIFLSEYRRITGDQRVDDRLDEYLTRLIQNLHSLTKTSLSLIYGLPGALHAVQLAGTVQQITELDRVFKQLLVQLLEQTKYYNRIEPSDYDWINGLAGVGTLFSDSDYANPLGKNYVDSLKLQAELLLASDYHLALDLGLAHGLSGLLLQLARAFQSSGPSQDGLKQIIKNVMTMLESTAYEDGSGRMNFPDKRGNRQIPNKSNSWCYGKSGVLYSLWYASRSLGDRSSENCYYDHLKASLYDRDGIKSVTFCHGLSGILTISNQLVRLKQAPDLVLLNERLISALQEQRIQSYQFIYKDYGSWFREELLDSPTYHPEIGLLNGALGVMLAQLSHFYQVPSYLEQLFLVSLK